MRVSSKNQVSGKFFRTAMAGLGLEPPGEASLVSTIPSFLTKTLGAFGSGIGQGILSKQNNKI